MVWIVLAIVWVALSIAVGNLAKEKGRNRTAWVLLSLVLCPLVTLVIVAPLSSPKEGYPGGELGKCPYCGGTISAASDFCPHCRCFDVKDPYVKPHHLA